MLKEGVNELFKRVLDLRGITNRHQFRSAFIVYILVSILINLIFSMFIDNDNIYSFYSILSVVLSIIFVPVIIRRLRGLGKSLVWLLVPLFGSCCCCLIGYIFYIWLLFAKDSQDYIDMPLQGTPEFVTVTAPKPESTVVPKVVTTVKPTLTTKEVTAKETGKIVKPVRKEITVAKSQSQTDAVTDIITTPVDDKNNDND